MENAIQPGPMCQIHAKLLICDFYLSARFCVFDVNEPLAFLFGFLHSNRVPWDQQMTLNTLQNALRIFRMPSEGSDYHFLLPIQWALVDSVILIHLNLLKLIEPNKKYTIRIKFSLCKGQNLRRSAKYSYLSRSGIKMRKLNLTLNQFLPFENANNTSSHELDGFVFGSLHRFFVLF